jgi:VanZ family protein
MLNLFSATHDRVAFITPRRCLFAALTFFALMIAAGAIPGKAEAASSVVGDKLLHFIAYAVLTGLVFGATRANLLSTGQHALYTLLVIAVLGVVDESIQALLPYRNANWADWKIDMLASISCVALLVLLQRFPLQRADAAR